MSYMKPTASSSRKVTDKGASRDVLTVHCPDCNTEFVAGKCPQCGTARGSVTTERRASVASRDSRRGSKSVAKAEDIPGGSPHLDEKEALKLENAKLKEEKGNLSKQVHAIHRMNQLLQNKVNVLTAQLLALGVKEDVSQASAQGPEPLPNLADEIYTEKVHALIKAQSLIRGHIIRRRFKILVRNFCGSEMAKPLRLRNKLVAEVHSTEASYVKGLETLELEYRQPILQHCGKEVADTIFLNVSTLLAVHRAFLQKVTAKVKSLPLPMQLGEMFIELGDSLECYKFYAENYMFARPALDQLAAEDSGLEAKLPGGKGWQLQLASLLITPIQRLPRYVLLLRDLVKYTVAEHQGKQALSKALVQMQRIATAINESTRAREGRAKVHEIVNSLEVQDPNVVMPIVRFGWLEYREVTGLNLLHSWQDRFFILRGNMLFGFKKEIVSLKPSVWVKKVTSVHNLQDFKVVFNKNQLREQKKNSKEPSHQIFFYDIVSGTTKRPKFIFGVKREVEGEAWVDAMESGRTSTEMEIYSNLMSKHRIVVLEGDLSVGTPAGMPTQSLEESTSALDASGKRGFKYMDAFVVLFNDMILITKRKSKRLQVVEAIHIPSITFIDAASVGLGKTDPASGNALLVCTALMARELVLPDEALKQQWSDALHAQWNRFSKQAEQHAGAKGTIAKEQLEDLKRQIDRRFSERDYLQSHISEAIDSLYATELSYMHHKADYTKLCQEMGLKPDEDPFSGGNTGKLEEVGEDSPSEDEAEKDHFPQEVASPRAAAGSVSPHKASISRNFHRRLTKASAEQKLKALARMMQDKEKDVREIQGEIDGHMERLNAINVKICTLVRERDGWADYYQAAMVQTEESVVPPIGRQSGFLGL